MSLITGMGPWQTKKLGSKEGSMTVTVSSVLGRPLWFELMTTDMKAAESFYRKVVGWSSAPFEASPMPYATFNRSGDTPVAGLMTKPAEVNAPPFWAMYIGVPRIEDAAAHITRLGWKCVLGDHRDPHGGAHADDEGPAGRGLLHL